MFMYDLFFENVSFLVHILKEPDSVTKLYQKPDAVPSIYPREPEVCPTFWSTCTLISLVFYPSKPICNALSYLSLPDYIMVLAKCWEVNLCMLLALTENITSNSQSRLSLAALVMVIVEDNMNGLELLL